MITKSQFARYTVDEFVKNNLEGDPTKLEETMVLQSSSLGVAMEFLGMIKSNELKEYVSSRGGTVIQYIDESTTPKLHVLSTREMLELLPSDPQ